MTHTKSKIVGLTIDF